MNNEQGTRRVNGPTPSGPSATLRSGGAGFTPLAISGSTAFFVTLVVLALLKATLMRHFTVGGWNLFSAAVLEGAFVVLVLGAFDLIAPRRNYWIDLVAYTALSALMLALTVYVSFYAQLFDPAVMAMAGQLGTVSEVVKELIRPSYALFLVDVPLLAVWAFLLGRADRARRTTSPRTAGRSRSALVVGDGSRPQGRSRPVAVLVAAAALVFATQLVFVHRLPSWIDGVAIGRARGLSVAQSAVFLPRSDAASLGDAATADEVDEPTTGTVQPASNTATASTTPGGKTQVRIDRIRGGLEGSRIATFPVGAYAGKNVIIIQVEALNTFLMQKKYDGQEITPVLNKLIGESWYFPNTYAETGIGNTADAEFISNTSLYAPRGQAASVEYADREMPSLPRLLKSKGDYYSFTIHPNKVEYWNRKQMYESLGFTRYYDSAIFHYADMMGEFGSSDEELFKRTTKIVRGLEASGTPFYSQIITLSAHTPFEFTPEARRPLKTPSDLEGSLMGKYISAESYSDFAIGKFIENLKATKLWDNSIVIIYGDHTAMLDNKLTGADGRGARKLLGRAYGPADRQRIPLIIHLPGQTTPVVRREVAAQVDLLPTVADLVGADITQTPHVGRSVFVASNALVPLNAYLPGGTFINDRVVFMPGMGFDDGTAVKVVDNSSTDPTDVEKRDLARALELMRISDKWIKSLPKRKNVGEMGWIPDPTARKAAEPYGALQQGIGDH